eukprot:15434047-Alexandrium_andersonii.AAC.1
MPHSAAPLGPPCSPPATPPPVAPAPSQKPGPATLGNAGGRRQPIEEVLGIEVACARRARGR